MRTPNSSCMICEKPLYRRPSDLARVRHVACMAHRGEAQRRSGVTKAQAAGLARGRVKGTNHRAGYRHRDESRAKVSVSNARWCAENPEQVEARGAKTRGEAHYRWNGGSSRLNYSIRRMTENRKWMVAVKARDGACLRCGSGEHLEAHHKEGLAAMIERLGISSRDHARAHAAALWDMDNGETLCRRCHYDEHGRTHHED